jgi:uncharacterized protein YjlB
MPLLEDAKKITEQITGWRRPTKAALQDAIRTRKPRKLRFGEDDLIPNHPRWPALIYRRAVHRARGYDPAAIFEDLFARNGWRDSWRGGVYTFLHYHSRIHEVLGIARGSVRIRLGGPHGRVLVLKAGDVVILPAGTGHQCLGASNTMLAVGAYPAAGVYDECRARKDDHRRALRSIPKVPRPRRHPIYGRSVSFATLWR